MRRLLLFPILISVVMQATGQLNKSVLLEYSESDFCLSSEAGRMYISSSTLDFGYDEDTTALALPKVIVNILIDPGLEYKSHTVSSTDSLVRSDIEVGCYELPIPTNVPFTVSSSVSSKHIMNADDTDSRPTEYIGTCKLGGFKYLRFKVQPFKYIQSKKMLYLRNRLTINISFTSNRQQNSLMTNSNLRETVRNMIVNKSDLDTLYPVSKYMQNGAVKSTGDYSYDYLIVTCDSLKDVFQNLAEWKTRKGVRAKIITTEDISATDTISSLQNRIKQAIKEYYDNSGHKLQYVLLAGDNEIVPTMKSRFTRTILKKVNDSIYYVTEHPIVATDMFYACFGNMDWDVNNDGVVEGEIDNIDYTSEVIVTRLSVNSVPDAQNQVNRIINYERNPKTANWEDNILLSGMTLDDKLYGEDRLSNTHIKCEQFFYPNYIRDNWSGHVKYMFYDTGTSFEGGRNYQFRTENLQEQISRGYTFLYMETHGEPNSWLMEWRANEPNPSQLFYTDDASNSINNGHTLITTSACLTNAFDSVATSLSEAFMRNSNAGIIGYYGSTNYGWYNPSLDVENPTASVIGKFHRSLFSDVRHQIGRAVYDSKRLYSSDKWHLTSMNALCDPEMPVFVSAPAIFDNVIVTLNNGNMEVTTGEQDCRICISSYDDCGNSYYVVTDTTSNNTYNIGNTTCSVCITKNGFIPYYAIVGNNVYLQDEVFNANTHVIAGNIVSGSDVTTSRPEGAVIIQNGKVSMQHTGNVTITKDFEVNKGAELEITGGT